MRNLWPSAVEHLAACPVLSRPLLSSPAQPSPALAQYAVSWYHRDWRWRLTDGVRECVLLSLHTDPRNSPLLLVRAIDIAQQPGQPRPRLLRILRSGGSGGLGRRPGEKDCLGVRRKKLERTQKGCCSPLPTLQPFSAPKIGSRSCPMDAAS